MASAKAGRRANTKTFDPADVDTDVMGGDFGGDKPVKKKSAPAKSGWGAESSDGPSGQSAEIATGFTDENSVEDDGIPMIPELPSDTVATIDVAHAPVTTSRVATIGELANDLQKQATYSIIDGETDISLIAKYVRGEAEVQEADEVWEWDQVFAEVASDLRQSSAVLEAVELTIDSKSSKPDGEKEKEKEREKEKEKEKEKDKDLLGSKDRPAVSSAPKGRRQKQPGQTSTIFDE